jgi:hypothetical protein
MLIDTGPVHHGNKLITVIDVVFHNRRLTGHRQRLADAVAGTVVEVSAMPSLNSAIPTCQVPDVMRIRRRNITMADSTQSGRAN